MKDLPSVTILMMQLKIMYDLSDEAAYHISGHHHHGLYFPFIHFRVHSQGCGNSQV